MNRACLAVAALVAVSLSTGPSTPARALGAAEVNLHFHADPNDALFGSVTVEGLPPAVLRRTAAARFEARRWAEILSLRVADAPPESPAILSSWSVSDRTILLRPRFLPRGGLELVAAFDGAQLAALLALETPPLPILQRRFVMPAAAAPPSTVVEAVYPSSPEVPENLLRLYLHFSAPMRAIDVPRHVHLYEDDGEQVELPFVEVETGLWDPARRRLTLFFHPGRIKRGVAPNLTMGPPLRAGRNYTLVVDRGLRDARGLPLAASHRTALRVGPPDRESPDPNGWEITAPRGAHQPVVVELDEPLDHAMLQRLIHVVTKSGDPIGGTIEVCCGERTWRFTPQRPWEEGEYVLEVAPIIEDLAGNTPLALFDEPLSGAASDEHVDLSAPEPLHLSFRFRLTNGGS